MRVRRVGAYGRCLDAAGRVLLARSSDASEFPGQWSLPGGGVEQGENPHRTVVREFAEETGLVVRVSGLHAVTADVARLPSSGAWEHTDRIVYDVVADAGVLRPETAGTTDRVAWAGPEDLADWPLLPFTARLLGRPAPPVEVADPSPEPARRPRSGQRFGAYAVATDPAGRVLLALIADGYPGAGRWHLPGGGTDHGETPELALHRELAEETSQHGRVVGLLGISHSHNPAAVGPDGVAVDWHVIRVLFRVAVDLPTEPVVTEAAGGSTAAAGWFDRASAGTLPLTAVAREALAGLDAETETSVIRTGGRELD